jgi:hypothetical protein
LQSCRLRPGVAAAGLWNSVELCGTGSDCCGHHANVQESLLPLRVEIRTPPAVREKIGSPAGTPELRVWSPIYLAAQRGCVQSLGYLLRSCKEHRCASADACQRCELCQSTLGALVDLPCTWGRTALHVACVFGHAPVRASSLRCHER